MTKTSSTAQSGQIVDRYGPSKGTYLSPEGTPYSQRGIPEGYKEYHKYEVIKPFEWTEGQSSPVPEFDSQGGGWQYKISGDITVDDLLKKEYLKKLE